MKNKPTIQKEDPIVTLYYSEDSLEMGRRSIPRDTASQLARVFNQNGSTKEVMYTALISCAPEEAENIYSWTDKQLVWSGPESQMKWLKSLEV